MDVLQLVLGGHRQINRRTDKRMLPNPSPSFVKPVKSAKLEHRQILFTMYREIRPFKFIYGKNDKSSSHNGTIQLKNLFFCPVQS